MRPRISATDKINAIERLDSIRQEILNDSLQFEQAVIRYSQDKNTVMNAGLMTNENSNVCYPPDHLQGLEPGSTSYDSASGTTYTGSPNWTSVTFKVTGALQNGYANNTWVPLRWFVFGPDSFGAPGTPDAYTATIEVSDPFTTYSPAYDEGWYDYIGSPVFYSWQIDESRRPRSVEMLKKDSTYEY